jgi:acyl-coenzyme A thioesterase PaaI-like protein
MAQIIKHRRGSLEALSSVTGSLQKGELVIASGSTNITASNGTSLVFAVPESGSVKAVNRILRGTNAPNIFPASIYNGMLDGVPYYASASSTLYLLGSDSNEAINLIGNIQPFSTSVDSRLDSVEASLGGGGDIGSSVTQLNTFTGSQLTQNSNLATISGSLISTASANTVSISNLNSYSASLKAALTASGTNVVFSNDVTIPGNLTVRGTQTIVDSTTVQIGDNIIELNGSGVANGGLWVKDATAPTTNTGSIVWDSTNDYWKAGTKGAESKVLLAGGDSVVSGSSQITLQSTTGFTAFDSALSTITGSLISSASAAKTTNDSQGVSITNLNTTSASVNVSIASLNSYTSSNTSTNALNAYTASAETRFTEIGVVSGSLISSASAAVIANANQNTFTASVATRLTEIGVVSGSLISSASNAASRLTTLEGTGTIQGVGTTNDVTFNKVTTAGDIVVGGDLVVQGNTVTLNTATLVVEDKLITLASGSTNASAANGAGIEVAGASANITYQSTPDAWQFNKPITGSAVTASINIPSNGGNSKRIAFRGTTDNIEFVTAPTTAGDLVQWDGSNFVMSNTIDGGSF